ncbi:flavodoxin domain-containing protein [Blastococcus sp. HT6-30]|uniref:flavodoxin domain-containing protein n=1 Tax=Blastococcus sp. HT6-30 TaxID=3144843 RepID=UPI00321BD74C
MDRLTAGPAMVVEPRSDAPPASDDLPPRSSRCLGSTAVGAGGCGPRVLVAFASRHGATREIAAALAQSLPASRAGRIGRLSTVLAPVELRPDPADFDAVVLGSAVYAGRWLEPARRYVGAVAPELRGRSTWLFSSGLVGDRPGPPDDDPDGRRIGDWIDALDHRVFPGRLERRVLSAAERAGWPAHAVVGDFRDWRAVRAWCEEIAAEVVTRHAVPVPG